MEASLFKRYQTEATTMASNPDKWKTIQLAVRGGWGTTARYIAIRALPATLVSSASVTALVVKIMLGL